MGDFYIKGKQVCGTTTNASAVTCLDKNGSQSTVQKEIENVQSDIDRLNSKIQQSKNTGTELLTESISTTTSITIPKSIANFNTLVVVVAYESVNQGRERTLIFNRVSRVSKDFYSIINTNSTSIGISCELNWNTGVITLDYFITSNSWTTSLPLIFQSIVGY